MRKHRLSRRSKDPAGVVAMMGAVAFAAAVVAHADAADATPASLAAGMCSPVTYSVDGALGPPTARSDVTEAMQELGSLTGIPFVERGIADRAVLRISWVRPPADWDVGTVGHGTAQWVRRAALESMRSGRVLLRAADEAPPIVWPHAIRHELGHVMGLEHGADAGVMFPTTGVEAAGWSDAERARLAARGPLAGCTPGADARIVG